MNENRLKLVRIDKSAGTYIIHDSADDSYESISIKKSLLLRGILKVFSDMPEFCCYDSVITYSDSDFIAQLLEIFFKKYNKEDFSLEHISKEQYLYYKIMEPETIHSENLYYIDDVLKWIDSAEDKFIAYFNTDSMYEPFIVMLTKHDGGVKLEILYVGERFFIRNMSLMVNGVEYLIKTIDGLKSY